MRSSSASIPAVYPSVTSVGKLAVSSPSTCRPSVVGWSTRLPPRAPFVPFAPVTSFAGGASSSAPSPASAAAPRAAAVVTSTA